MIVIVDFGMGNVGSILNMLRKVGASAMVSARPADIECADRLILPGVGSFDAALQNLDDRGLPRLLNHMVLERGTPILGICLGMQLLAEHSQEGKRPGLGWIQGGAIRFDFSSEPSSAFKIPHMGWNTITPLSISNLFACMPPTPRFYFVHSYHVVCTHRDNVLATCNYGGDFTAALGKGNIWGVQFHPEKSHKFGLQLLQNFAELPC